jgi:putative FmdB family regulatory protein
MPTYEYRCRKCEHRFELFHSIKDDTPRRCPRCRGRAVRVPAGGAAVIFKGSGFHITDYRSSEYKEKARQETASSAGKGESAGGSAATGKGGSGGEGTATGKGGHGKKAPPGGKSD